MTNLQRDYLREMGIDVWVLRENAVWPPAAREPAREPTPFEAQPPTVISGRGQREMPAADRAGSRAGETGAVSPGGPPAAYRSAIQNLLQQTEPAVSKTPEASTKSEVKTEITPETAAPATPSSPFQLFFLIYEAGDHSLGIVAEGKPDAADIAADVKRFADDLALACHRRALAARVQTFRWPMVRNQQIPQTDDEARIVLRNRLRECPPTLLVFGDTAVSFLAGSGVTGLHTVDGHALWCLPPCASYFSGESSKRALWQLLRKIFP
ncbi:MAG: hypothetical protein KDI36_12115 [Pseudomonadales bacterium]|nr:hypothetical protein [Pseudomonadales bacterium]